MIRRSTFFNHSLTVAVLMFLPAAWGQAGGQLRFCLRAEPKTFNPILVDDQYSETIRYLTGGVLIRVNRRTQELEPELAVSWKIERGGRGIVFQLRRGLQFSDGSPFSAADVAYTMHALLDPNLHSPSGDAFRSGPGDPLIRVLNPYSIAIEFPAPLAGMARLFDQVAILSSRSPRKEMAVLGPFMLAEHKAGAGKI